MRWTRHGWMGRNIQVLAVAFLAGLVECWEAVPVGAVEEVTASSRNNGLSSDARVGGSTVEGITGHHQDVQEEMAEEMLDEDLEPVEFKRHRKRKAPHLSDTGMVLRWLWFPAVVYFFWAQAQVCDEHFVPTIEVICDTFAIPEDVAGATIMALGCNGPELFLNLLSIKEKSDIGVGAVIGGEVFNVLVLCGCALLATPAAYMPLQLSKLSYSRDCFFYAVSIALLYAILQDSKVVMSDGPMLLGVGALYSTSVALTHPARQCFKRAILSRPALAARLGVREPAAALEESGDIEGDVTLQPTISGSNAEAPAEEGLGGVESIEGFPFQVRVQVDNRMMDRSRNWDTRMFWLTKHGLVVSTEVLLCNRGRTARGIVYTRSFGSDDGQWRHSGLVNVPVLPEAILDADGSHLTPMACRSVAGATGSVVGPLPSERTKRRLKTNGEPLEFIPFKDIVQCEPPSSPMSTCFELSIIQRGEWSVGQIVRLELRAADRETCDKWVESVSGGMRDVARAAFLEMAATVASSEQPASLCGSCLVITKKFLREWLEWLCFPVQSMLRLTIPDVRKLRFRKWWPVAFITSMVWLAVFAYCVILTCNQLHQDFGISTTILGFTVAAVGTSFPNVISCIAVSKRGKTSMAIANALGANIQNVFLALALPWTIQAAISNGEFMVSDASLLPSVLWMSGTLILMVVSVLLARCRKPRWMGYLFLVIYAVYFVCQLGEELACETFPFC